MNTKCIVLFAIALGAVAATLHAGPRTSANYSILAEAIDSGGVTTGSANYQNTGSAGLISGTSTTVPGTGVLKSGYIAQLEDKNAPLNINLSGTISYCSNPSPNPVSNVTLTLTGAMSGLTVSNGSGNYTFSSLPAGGNYIVTPSKAARVPGSAGINTVDVLAVQKQFLNILPLLTACHLAAADVNASGTVNTVDVIAIQKFFLNNTGTANVGKYQFTPASRSYTPLTVNQTAQDYATLIFGDVIGTFADRAAGGPSQDVAGDDMMSYEVASTVAAVVLPEVSVAQLQTPSRVQAAKSNFIAAVRTTAIDTKSRLVGFQGDFTFDERVVTFQEPPVQNAGLTAGNWNVSGNVLPGAGPIRTLRISAFSNDFTPLAGEGTLFELRMTRVSRGAQGTPLLWAAPPDHFIFIDADLTTQKPGNAAW